MENSRCVCSSGYYRSGNVCKECHVFCSECTGPSNTECLPNNCRNGAYPLHSVATTCLQMCETGEHNLYINTTSKTCMPCISPCKSCFAGTNESCSSCIENYVLHKNTCIDKCLDGYFESEGLCFLCDPKCVNCIKRVNYCINGCVEPYVFMDNKCLTNCGEGYVSVNRICERCGVGCDECRLDGSFKTCTKCKVGRYLHNNECLEVCPSTYYVDIYNGRCAKCNQACFECFGSSNRNCYSCNNLLGFVMIVDNTCSLPSCADGYYFNEELKVCGLCPKECSKCVGAENCTACIEGYTFDYAKKKCYDACNKIGFMRIANSFDCVEICGDGKNMGRVECDDGNLKDNDGCSSKCKVERYYECSGGTQDTPDVCVYKKPVDIISFRYSADRSATLTFDTKIKILAPLEDLLNITLSKAETPSVKWSYETFNTWSFNKIKFKLEFSCSLIGTEVILFFNGIRNW